MRFRAMLITDEKIPRAIQCFFNELEDAKKWARTILEGRPMTDRVTIWQTQESLAANIWADEVNKTTVPDKVP